MHLLQAGQVQARQATSALMAAPAEEEAARGKENQAPQGSSGRTAPGSPQAPKPRRSSSRRHCGKRRSKQVESESEDDVSGPCRSLGDAFCSLFVGLAGGVLPTLAGRGSSTHLISVDVCSVFLPTFIITEHNKQLIHKPSFQHQLTKNWSCFPSAFYRENEETHQGAHQ